MIETIDDRPDFIEFKKRRGLKMEFKAGDWVECINDTSSEFDLISGVKYVIKDVFDEFVRIKGIKNEGKMWDIVRFRKVTGGEKMKVENNDMYIIMKENCHNIEGTYVDAKKEALINTLKAKGTGYGLYKLIKVASTETVVKEVRTKKAKQKKK